jgi:pimeloyl-ACP methyl ester carboxylesterase
VSTLLPHEQPFVLIAESFSGPIAIDLASRRPRGLCGLILCASFAKAPRPLLAPFRKLIGLMRWPLWPMPLVMAVMMGRWATPAWKERLYEALKALDLRVFHRRVMDAATVDATAQAQSIDCPVLYLQAHQDRVVPARAAAELRACTNHMESAQLEGPHMLFAAKPLECAAIIKRWVAALRR